MRIISTLLACGIMNLVAFTTASGQIEIISDHAYRAYLQFEPIVFQTTLKSKIGQPVVLNSDPGPRFYFVVRDDRGHQLAQQRAHEPDGALLMAAQGSVALTNEMNRIFPMSEPGQYSIQPCVDWNGKTYAGEKRHIEVVRGREISAIEAVVPSDNSRRMFTVFHINRGQQDHLLLRVDDESEGVTYGVFSLGRSVMNVKPQLAVDAEGNAHVLMQSAPRTYLHAVYSPSGTLVRSDYFGRDYATVTLESKPNGTIEAVGRAIESDEPKPLQSVIEGR